MKTHPATGAVALLLVLIGYGQTRADFIPLGDLPARHFFERGQCRFGGRDRRRGGEQLRRLRTGTRPLRGVPLDASGGHDWSRVPARRDQ